LLEEHTSCGAYVGWEFFRFAKKFPKNQKKFPHGRDMTRLIYVDDELVILLETDLPPAALVEAIQANRWPLPPPLATLAGPGETGDARLRGLRAVRLGRLVIVSPVDAHEGAPHPVLAGTTPLELSPRQRQVLQGLADGLTTRQIAARLGLHERTVDLHIAAIKRRFGTNSRMQSVLRGAALGLCKIKPEAKSDPVIGYTRPSVRGPTRSRPPREKNERRTLPDSTDQ
jgi:DNA-binding CsgD family transcriptional regulator